MTDFEGYKPVTVEPGETPQVDFTTPPDSGRSANLSGSPESASTNFELKLFGLAVCAVTFGLIAYEEARVNFAEAVKVLKAHNWARLGELAINSSSPVLNVIALVGLMGAAGFTGALAWPKVKKALHPGTVSQTGLGFTDPTRQ